MNRKFRAAFTKGLTDATQTLLRNEWLLVYCMEGIFLIRFLDLLVKIKAFFLSEMNADIRSQLIKETRAVLDEFLPAKKEVLYYYRYLAGLLDEIEAISPLENTDFPWIKEKKIVSVTPSMTSEEVLRYYFWLSKNLMNGIGHIVELGSWLGASTRQLVEGIRQNAKCDQVKVFAIDSYNWQDWMDFYLNGTIFLNKPKTGEHFLDLFRQINRPFLDRVIPIALDISPHNDNNQKIESVALFQPCDAPIEVFLYDFGNNYNILDASWKLFSSNFIKDKTIIIFHEYGKLNSIEIRKFCRQKGLLPLHKPFGSVKSFIFN